MLQCNFGTKNVDKNGKFFGFAEFLCSQLLSEKSNRLHNKTVVAKVLQLLFGGGDMSSLEVTMRFAEVEQVKHEATAWLASACISSQISQL